MANRFTVNLTDRAVASLLEITLHDSVSKTDAVNRALQVYAFLLQEQTLGKMLLLGKEGEIGFERVHIV